MSNSCFCTQHSDQTFPVNLSPSKVSVYSMGMTLSMNFRTTENVSFPSLNCAAVIFSSFWSGQVIVPSTLSPSFLIVRSAVRFWSPIEYAHFHVPAGSAFSPCALASPQNPSTNAAARIVFMLPPRSSGRGCPTRTASSPDRHSKASATTAHGWPTVLSTLSSGRCRRSAPTPAAVIPRQKPRSTQRKVGTDSIIRRPASETALPSRSRLSSASVLEGCLFPRTITPARRSTSARRHRPAGSSQQEERIVPNALESDSRIGTDSARIVREQHRPGCSPIASHEKRCSDGNLGKAATAKFRRCVDAAQLHDVWQAGVESRQRHGHPIRNRHPRVSFCDLCVEKVRGPLPVLL